jgi:hypothetical protein
MNVNSSYVLRHKYIIFSISLCHLFLISCSFNTKNEKKATVCDSVINRSSKLEIENVSSVKLEYFDGLPDVFKNDGGDMYTYDSVKLDDKKYIFLSNLSGMAAVRINGREIYLKPDSSQFTVRDNGSYQEVWVGEVVQIVLIIKVVSGFKEDEGEGSYLEGVLELKTKNTTSKIKIHGYTEV